MVGMRYFPRSLFFCSGSVPAFSRSAYDDPRQRYASFL